MICHFRISHSCRKHQCMTQISKINRIYVVTKNFLTFICNSLYFYVGDLFCIHLGTKYAQFQEKIFADISGRKFQTLYSRHRLTGMRHNYFYLYRFTKGLASFSIRSGIKQATENHFSQCRYI